MTKLKVKADELLTVPQVAAIRETSRKAVYDLIQRGRLPIVDIGGNIFVRRGDLAAFQAIKTGRPKSIRYAK